MLVISTMLWVAVVFSQSNVADDGTLPYFDKSSLWSLLAFGIAGGLLIHSGRQEPRVAEDGSRYGYVFFRQRLFAACAFVPLMIFSIWHLLGDFTSTAEFIFWLLLLGVSCFFLRLTWVLRIWWNRKELRAKTPFFARNVTYGWSDLTALEDQGRGRAVVLTFASNGTVKVPSNYEGHKDLIAYAKDRLDKA